VSSLTKLLAVGVGIISLAPTWGVAQSTGSQFGLRCPAKGMGDNGREYTNTFTFAVDLTQRKWRSKNEGGDWDSPGPIAEVTESEIYLQRNVPRGGTIVIDRYTLEFRWNFLSGSNFYKGKCTVVPFPGLGNRVLQ
jgi:hypothetical protein